MNQVYRPSGKVSFLFVPVFIVMFLITALSALVCIFCIHFSPYTLFDILIFVFLSKWAAQYGALWCVKYGKVRNPVFSALSGLLFAVLYWYFLIIFYFPVKTMFAIKSFYWLNEPLLNFLHIFRFKELHKAFLVFKNNGAAVTGRKGDVLFTVQGTAGVVILSIFCVITLVYFAMEFYENSCYPFCEKSGKWMKEIIFACSMPEDSELFLSKLLLGGLSVLYYLEPLYEVNVSYCKVSLFTNNIKDKFYISLSYMENNGSTDKKTGKTVFDEKVLVKYLLIDKDTGNSLLMGKAVRPGDAGVLVVTDETERKAKAWMAFNWIIGILAISLCVFAIFKMGDDLPEFLFRGGFFYIVFIFFINAARFIHSLQKEMVINSTEDRYQYDGTKKYLVKEKSLPAMFKLFYLFMMFSAAGLFVLCRVIM